MDREHVTVIGLGPMGRAMAGALLKAGHPVTVWNRTPERADELVARGAVRAASPRDALAAGTLVVLSLTDYAAAYAVLDPVADALAGRDLVNLSSDTPARAREGADWARAHGARHLTGGVLSPPSGIGSAGSTTLYSGPAEVLEAHRGALAVLTGIDHLGEDSGLAALYYQLQMDVFWTSMLAYLHAVALAGAHGVSARRLLPFLGDTFTGMPEFLKFYTSRIDAGEYPGDVDRLAMGTESVRHIVHTARDSGIDPALPAAVLEIFERGMADGRAADSFTSLIETMRSART
ncbi:NAD(P)-dependent oxidoreductase [Allonocardiopsis opalescens]|uniref:3-hydroxyisobutyrate dehydrogenase-like beta-hydroxyacid dehydrogenase n=1 Tax=Allonocardiopsis opalescens TaxID=1144618 RepID=A0A2T0Q565_9ACTN|nr:NAD(P)-binding domain-containing protein [Allonocardiopsis opalescens]PRX98913.1 3-hydroxyisobutyrate dehydrogenase-like beta-hydroxyacid dehydrogenase [Allonocardiopsis opalescens]